ncbi:AAA family ATPase [Sinanaerobacter chloroacetimidivorans]|uniref:ATP-binding protein n=1 Tax=Sinanaerobacter chloroacetimidivorans TaxID=2818044 RepID=A0A8J7W5W7_9FIRM|nr:ATP-binding protein [Sinanaerobacter chloroacetimidivorans]MBR0599775.1 ATP-binding protein [Sinanaerobacter chloroacetimidivorans]
MKSELIEKLIIAHCDGDENKFIEALNKLVKDEEKKGNVPTASRLMRAYDNNKKSGNVSTDFSPNTTVFSSQMNTPRDKDSLLELYEIVHSKMSLDDVILPEKQKDILEQIVSEQNNAEELLKHNMPPINRVLLCGPPGCGKTMTAYALGHELNLPIAYVRLDGLVSSYLGQTSTNLRKVFDSVRNQRIILFLDEFDAIAKKRDDSNELGELKRVVTTLLQNFDNMPGNVFLIAATNHEHLLDPAIWRRFNVTITLELPNEEQRRILIEKGISKYGVEPQIDYKLIAKVSEGINGAQIGELTTAAAKKNLINKKLKTEDVIDILIQQLSKFSDSGNEPMKVIHEMMERGVSLRTAAKALGMSHNTLDYQLKKYRGELDNE